MVKLLLITGAVLLQLSCVSSIPLAVFIEEFLDELEELSVVLHNIEPHSVEKGVEGGGLLKNLLLSLIQNQSSFLDILRGGLRN